MTTHTLVSKNSMLNAKEGSVPKDDIKGSKSNATTGRRGDPRMHRAVNARLENPNMSLLEALIVGGFKFPNGTKPRHSTGTDKNTSDKSTRHVYDSDNVLLTQRKNQLSRRIRLAKKRSYEKRENADSTTGNLQRNRLPKRGFSDLDKLHEEIAATRLKISHNDVNSTDRSSLSLLRAASLHPESLLLNLLQQKDQLQQRTPLQGNVLVQTQACMTPSSSFRPLYQGHEQESFRQDQISPINICSSVGGLFKHSENQNHFQNPTQEELELEYLKKLIVKSASRLADQQSTLLPHESKAQIDYQSCDPNQSQSQVLQLLQYHNLLNDMRLRNTSRINNMLEINRMQQENTQRLEHAGEILDLKRNALIQRYLTLLPPERPIR